MLWALFVLLLPSSGNGIRRRNQLRALITPHRQINKYLIWTPKSDFIILLMGLKCFSNTAIFKDHVFAKRLSKKENRLHERPKNAHTRTEFKDSLCYRFIQIEEIFWKEIPRKKKKCNLRKLKLSSVRFARYLQYIISGTEIGGKEHPPTRTQLHQHFHSSLLITKTRLVCNNTF